MKFMNNGIFISGIGLLLLSFQGAMGQLTLTNHPQPAGYTPQQTSYRNDMKIDQSNMIWMGFRDIGLGKYDGANWVMYDSLSQGLPSNNIYAIDFGATGEVWAGTAYGATKYDGSSWTNYNTINSGLPHNTVTVVSCDPSLTWFGTHNGIASFDGTAWTTYNTANSGLINDTVTCIRETPSGVVWVGTMRGVSRFANNVWTTYDSTTSAIPSSQIYSLEFDNHGNTWVSAGWGVFVIDALGQVLTFQEDLYQHELPVTPTGKVDFAKDNTGRILFKVNASSYFYVFRYDNLQYQIFQSPTYYQGASFFGYCFETDSNNQIWFSPKRDGSISSFISLDLNSYQPGTNNYALSFDNYKHLDISGVKALMLNRGDMHWDVGNAKYEVPKGSGINSVYASALWIGGLDAGGNIHLAAQTYRQTGFDYWPGPISGMSLPFDSVSCAHYDKIWKISKWEVEAFKVNFANGSISNGTAEVPAPFLSWPAKGNNFITDDKAPFVDYNSDNLYNPYDGDYPLIKGDQMLFWMFNDSLAVHTATDGPTLGVEIHASAYAYSCPGIADSNAVVNTTTLYNFRIINRSAADYNSVYMGLWCDTDLGYSVDDFIGCDSSLAAGFTYNGDNDDGNSGGYGLNPPMQNVVILKGTLADAGDGLDNDLDNNVDEPGERTTMNHFHTYYGIGIFENPHSDQDHYNYMRSLWLNGTPVTWGGWGSGGTIPVNFIYSGTPYDTGWTEINVGNPTDDRRFLLSSGPVSLPAGGEMTIDFAYVFTRDSLNPNGLTTSVARNIADVQRVHSWFNNDNFPSCEQYATGIQSFDITEQILTIHPNPIGNILSFSHNFLEHTELNFTISDVAGKIVKLGTVQSNEINCLALDNGIYFLRINNKDSQQTGLFVKTGN